MKIADRDNYLTPCVSGCSLGVLTPDPSKNITRRSDELSRSSGGDDIEGIVSAQMKRDFQKEKEMNHRLQEELRRCEKERLRILERIKYLSGEKEVVIESVDGVKKTFKVTQINIENLLKSVEDQKGRLISDEEMVR